MKTVKEMTLISASPKVGEPSVSDWLSGHARSLIEGDGISIHQINVRNSIAKNTKGADYETMLTSDALVFIFPLYIFCLPGIMIRYLQDFYTYFKSSREHSKISKVFCAVNCGFPEDEINAEAVRVIKSFSGKINAEFRFGLMIGGGGMLLGAADAPFMKKTLSVIDRALMQMKTDMLTDSSAPVRDIQTRANFPRRLYFFGAGQGWRSMAKKNKLRNKDLYATPYL
jgi:multimeric flavodoxin WrbA